VAQILNPAAPALTAGLEEESLESALCVPVYSQTQTAEARRTAMQLAAALAFDDVDAGNVGLVVTEAAKNLVKHAGGGDLILRAIENNGSAAVEMLALDKGPGILDIGRSFQDGYSTAGTPGGGLGAISRLSTFHDIYSQPEQGTVLLAHIGRRDASRRTARAAMGAFLVGAVSVAMRGEPVCGDAWGFQEISPGCGRLILADGLGHGLLAADAARAAIRIGHEYPGEHGVDLVERIHEALRPTRGAAVAVAEIDADQHVVRYTGVGNIGGVVVPPSAAARHMVSQPGTAGHEVRKMVEFSHTWEPGSMLVMHSDGLHTHWSLQRYPGLMRRHPALIAGVLYRDFVRGRDDATVAVVCGAAEVQ
jgi:anti-sigma regulatory factor (Ser/Thr protein kinase)